MKSSDEVIKKWNVVSTESNIPDLCGDKLFAAYDSFRRKVTVPPGMENVQGDKKRPNPFAYDIVTEQPAHGISQSGSTGVYMWDGTAMVRAWEVDTYRGPFGYGVASYDGDLSTLTRNAAYNKALSKVYDAVRNSDANLLVTIGERHETLEMLRGIATGLSQFKRTLRKAAKSAVELSGSTNMLASGWLGYQYGIRPLLNDIHALAHYVTVNGLNGCIASAKGRGSETEKSDKLSRSLDSDVTTVTRTTFEGSARCEIQLSYGISDPAVFNLARVTSLNPAALAYELTTLSFVVDWFVDIGSYLQNIEASLGLGLSFKEGYVTTTEKRTWTWSESRWASSRVLTPNQRLLYSEMAAQKSATSLRRSVLTSFPSPRFPTVHVKLGAERLLSAASLLRTIGLSRYR